jgi:hypothetical protein
MKITFGYAYSMGDTIRATLTRVSQLAGTRLPWIRGLTCWNGRSGTAGSCVHGSGSCYPISGVIRRVAGRSSLVAAALRNLSTAGPEFQ